VTIGMLNQQVVTFAGDDLGFVVNDHGVIDATAYFNTGEFMAGGPERWALAAPPEVHAVLLHHWGGWYGPRLDAKATPSEEFAQIVGCARDHRERFGIGPGYSLNVFPSGRVWAVGKHGTHRAHTAGREPQTRERWNVVGRAVAVAGDYETEDVTVTLARGIRDAIAEVTRWPGAGRNLPVFEHGLTPTVDSAGVMFAQATPCPGRNLAAWRAAGGLTLNGAESHQPDRFGEGYVQGYRVGFGRGVKDVLAAFDDAMDAGAALISAPPDPPVVPAAPPVLTAVSR